MQDASNNYYNAGEIVASRATTTGTYVDVDTTGWATSKSWKFRVRAYDALGVRGDWSDTASGLVLIGGVPSSPQNIVYNGDNIATHTESPLTVTWEAPATTYGLSYSYEVRLDTWNGSSWVEGTPVNKGTATSHSFTITSLTRGQLMMVAVRATNSVGSSYWVGNGRTIYYNRLPSTPTLVFPKSSSTIYNTSPRIGYLYGTDADGQSVLGSVTLNSITKDANDSAWSKTGRQTTAAQSLVKGWTLSAGNYTATAIGNDGLVNSSQTQRSFTVATPSWTDSTLTPKVTTVKAAHINELRTVISNIRNYYNLSAPTWSETIATGGQIKAAHITELRQAVEAIRTYVNGFDTGTSKDISTFTWTDSSLANKRIKAVHITELRNAITLL